MISSEPFFSQEEMLTLKKVQLYEILTFLGISYEPRDTKSTLIAKLQDYQVSMQQIFAGVSSEPPRYSVRVRAIMERKERENGT